MRWLKNYCDNKIWFTRLSELNDPFEGYCFFDYDYSKKINNLNPKLYKEWREHEGLTEFDPNFATLCLSCDPSNIVMWAHYADNHSGYCIEFEIEIPEDKYADVCIPSKGKKSKIFIVESDVPNRGLVFKKIDYKKEPPTIRYSDDKKLHESYRAWLEYNINHSCGVKYNLWQYEKEYRIITEQNGLVDFNKFPLIKINSIILGEKFLKNLDEEARECLYKDPIFENGDQCQFKKFLEKQNIKLLQASCSRKKYKVEIAEIK